MYCRTYFDEIVRNCEGKFSQIFNQMSNSELLQFKMESVFFQMNKSMWTWTSYVVVRMDFDNLRQTFKQHIQNDTSSDDSCLSSAVCDNIDGACCGKTVAAD